jgi:hypothetical protein
MFEEMSEELLQARLEELKVREPQQQCANRHKVTRLCTNPDCKEALLCSEPDCTKCADTHKECPLSPSRGSARCSMRVSAFIDFAEQMLQIEITLVARIQQNRSRLLI